MRVLDDEILEVVADFLEQKQYVVERVRINGTQSCQFLRVRRPERNGYIKVMLDGYELLCDLVIVSNARRVSLHAIDLNDPESLPKLRVLIRHSLKKRYKHEL